MASKKDEAMLPKNDIKKCDLETLKIIRNSIQREYVDKAQGRIFMTVGETLVEDLDKIIEVKTNAI